MINRKIFTRIALASLLATGLATAALAWGSSGWGGGDSGCCGKDSGKYRMPNGNLTNVRPARRASAARPKATTPARAAKTATPRKKVNFTTKKK